MHHNELHPGLDAPDVIVGAANGADRVPHHVDDLHALLGRRRTDGHAQAQRAQQQVRRQVSLGRLRYEPEELLAAGRDEVRLERRHYRVEQERTASDREGDTRLVEFR